MEFEQDPRKSLIIALAAATLIEAVKQAEDQKDSDPKAAVVWEWMEPYVTKIEQATKGVEMIFGNVD